MNPVRAAFVMEQTLGHVTHSRNLRTAAQENGGIDATWLPIHYPVRGVQRAVPLLGTNWSVRASWRARRALDAALRSGASGELQAVVFHTQVTALFSHGIMRRIPSVISLDATPLNFDSMAARYGHRAAGNGVLDRAAFRANRRAFHAATALVTWSEWARRSLVDDYGVPASRVRVIAPGASSLFFKLGEARGEQYARNECSADRPVRLLFVGGDFQRKGGPLLLDCMRRGLDRSCELHLVTREAVAPQRGVHVHNGVEANSPELLRLFTEADIFVLPSMAECLSVAVMEAMAAGLPVVTTHVGALHEAVRHESSGLLVPAGDGLALRAALGRLAGDRALRRQMGAFGYALARQWFDARRNNDALLSLVEEVGRGGYSGGQVGGGG